MTVIAIILAGSAPLQFSLPRELVVNMRQPHCARVRACRNYATNAGRGLSSSSTNSLVATGWTPGDPKIPNHAHLVADTEVAL